MKLYKKIFLVLAGLALCVVSNLATRILLYYITKNDLYSHMCANVVGMGVSIIFSIKYLPYIQSK